MNLMIPRESVAFPKDIPSTWKFVSEPLIDFLSNANASFDEQNPALAFSPTAPLILPRVAIQATWLFRHYHRSTTSITNRPYDSTDTGRVTPLKRPWSAEYSMNCTPIKKAQGHSKFSVDLQEIRERHSDIASESHGHFIHATGTGNPARREGICLLPWRTLESPKCIQNMRENPLICRCAGSFVTQTPTVGISLSILECTTWPEERTTDHSLMETQTELKGHANCDAFVDLEDKEESLAGEEDGKGDEEEVEVEEEET
ncbi:hypothetical protein IW261DRAFT_1426174 [Armillaria novae-zelandiae]|uniref:Uncharacterized protein n=1 Tax=Armillaria novae-zelandiae TaxID=153914 RepID=A0AA39TSD1_9AGAR|nr:hypothetical protein IW261DRAFT_1426174 [Armillaria novae-zelandiae]